MKKIFFTLLLFSFQLLWGIDVQLDSLSVYSLVQLEQKINTNRVSHPELAMEYAQAYLKNVNALGSDRQLVKAYYYLIDLDSKVQKTMSKELSIRFSDSIIALSQNKGHGFFSAYGYYIRGKEKYKANDYKAALDDYIIADKLISATDTLDLKYWIKNAIGNLKNNIGDNEGALTELYVALKYYEKEKRWDSYGLTAFSIAEIHREEKKIDSAIYYIERAKDYLKGSDFIILNHFAMSSGILEYDRAHYKNAIVLLSDASERMRNIEDEGNRAFCEYYLGHAKLHLKDTLSAIPHFIEVDSIYHQSKHLDPKLRTNYIFLIDYHQKKGDTEKELYYIKTLLQLDSLTQSYNSYLQSNIIKEYDVPKLLERKEKLISIYKVKEQQWSFYIIILSTFLGILMILFFFHRKKETKKNQQYEKIIAEFQQAKNEPRENTIKVKPARTSKIPQKDVERIQAAFLKYETQLLFAKSTFNKDFIRKDTQINDHYITDYLRDYIGSSLTTYINNKRIELSIKKMLEDHLYGKYTMQAMAETVGYTNVSTFKRAFKERTGMRPLEFLDKRKKKQDNS